MKGESRRGRNEISQNLKTKNQQNHGVLLATRRMLIYKLTLVSGGAASGDPLFEHDSVFEDGIVDRAIASAFEMVAPIQDQYKIN